MVAPDDGGGRGLLAKGRFRGASGTIPARSGHPVGACPASRVRHHRLGNHCVALRGSCRARAHDGRPRRTRRRGRGGARTSGRLGSLLEAVPRTEAASYQPYWALAAHLLASLGRKAEAGEAYELAIGLCEDPAMREWLRRQALARTDAKGSMAQGNGPDRTAPASSPRRA